MKIKVKRHYKTPGQLVGEQQLVNLVSAAQNLAIAARTHASNERKQYWFGNLETAKMSNIDTRCQKIENYLKNLKWMTFRCSNESGSIASYGQKPKEMREGGPSIADLNGSPAININAGFHQGRYSWGEKVCSILHEITHMTIGTSDQLVNGHHAYGAVECIALAKANPALAYNNADNWAYYMGSYHEFIAQSGNDWRYMTVEEVARRTAHTITM